MRTYPPGATRAYGIVNSARMRGELVPKPCKVCGGSRFIEAHHRDYRFPLDVTWLCRSHHVQLHYMLTRQMYGASRKAPAPVHTPDALGAG